MNHPKISVVVPIYNVEKYLCRCVDSLLSQTFQDYEIILVDDGSTDNSGIICDRYKKSNSKIKVLHKENGGLSDARNFGLLEARGKYISFIDGDDFIISTAYEKLVSELEAKKAEIITANALMYFSENNIKPKMKKRNLEERIYNGEEFLKISIQQNAMSMCVPFSIYKRDLLIKHNLFFEKGVLHEDVLWTPQVFLAAKKVIYMDLDFYMHFQREGSITKQKDKTKNAIDLITHCYKLEDIYKEVKDKETSKVLYNRLVTTYLSAIFLGRLHKKRYNSIISRDFLLKYSHSKKNKLKVRLFCTNRYIYFIVNFLIKLIINENRRLLGEGNKRNGKAVHS